MDYIETRNLRVDTLTGIVSLRIIIDDDVEWEEIGHIDDDDAIVDNLPSEYDDELPCLIENWMDSQEAGHRVEALSRDLEPSRWR